MVRLYVCFNKTLLSLEEFNDNVSKIGEIIKLLDGGFVTVKELIDSIFKVFKDYKDISVYIPDSDTISFSGQTFVTFDDTKYGWLTKDIKECNLVTDSFNPDDVVLCLSDPIKKPEALCLSDPIKNSESVEVATEKKTFIVTMYLKNGMILMDTLPVDVPIDCGLKDMYKLLIKASCDTMVNDDFISFDRTATRCDSIESIEFRIRYDDEEIGKKED